MPMPVSTTAIILGMRLMISTWAARFVPVKMSRRLKLDTPTSKDSRERATKQASKYGSAEYHRDLTDPFLC